MLSFVHIFIIIGLFETLFDKHVYNNIQVFLFHIYPVIKLFLSGEILSLFVLDIDQSSIPVSDMRST